MKYLKNILLIILGSFLLLFIGVKEHPEFNEYFVFLKYKPTFKVMFRTPIGDSDKKLEDLSPELQKEELAYNEYAKTALPRTVDYLALLLSQIGLFLITWNLLRLIPPIKKRKIKFKKILEVNFLGVLAITAIYQIFWVKSITLPIAILLGIAANFVLIYRRMLRKKK
ncbi:MAG: hypothetical protein GY810_05790 [Aureispira sp.]|nr:hypothetical protein [Aureispira sp.]